MDNTTFYEVARPLFGGSFRQSQVDGIEDILAAFDEVGDARMSTLAYALATAFHETGKRMVPVREGFASSDAGARMAVNKLAQKLGPASAVAKYAKPCGPYGHVYYGRGHVQLTWLDNYQRCSPDAGVDLVKDPDAMLDPRTSARVLVKGVIDGRWNGQGKGIDFYADADGDPDMNRAEYEAARRTVNLTDKASQIAGYAEAFEEALRKASWKPKKADEKNQPSLLLAIVNAISSAFRKA
jgi:predicted chitinase